MSDKTSLLSAYFDRVANDFDSVYSSKVSIRRFINWLPRRALINIHKNLFKNCENRKISNVLDVGCGPGFYVEEFARRGISVVGIDLSENMLSRARQRIVDGGYSNVTLVLGDIMNIESPSRFDLVICIGVFDYVVDPAALMKKICCFSNDLIVATFPSPSLIRSKLRSLRYMFKGIDIKYYDKEDIIKLAEDAKLNIVCLIHEPKSGGGYMLFASKGDIRL